MTRRPGARRIAFATHQASPELTDDDRRAVPALEAVGWAVEPVPWDRDGVAWEAYDAVILRSTWDYHLRAADFLAWTERVRSRRVPLWNPAGVARWNADKRYLRALEGAGVAVAPTEWLSRGRIREIPDVLGRRGWHEAVVKPTVSATAHVTHRLLAGERIPRPLHDAPAGAGWMVQPFLEEVATEGEWSLVYFAAPTGALELSHAVIKRPAPGDFRVQEEHGGRAVGATPPPEVRAQADRAAATAVRLAPGPLLYARVDGVLSAGAHAPAGTFLTLELELIEPALYLAGDAGAADRFAAALVRRLDPPDRPGA